MITGLFIMGSTSSAIDLVKDYVGPIMKDFIAIAAILSVALIVYGGILYMTSSGRPDKLGQAKRVLKNALIGVTIVIGSGTLVAILTSTLHGSAPATSAVLPSLTTVQPNPVDNGLVEVILKSITGLLSSLIQAVAAPFLNALAYFTNSTPLMRDNQTIYNFWLVIVGIADVLFTLVVSLIGFQIMSASALGLDEVEFKHFLPRIVVVFLLANTSIFWIDGVIGLSNMLIKAINSISGATPVWQALISVVQNTGVQGLAALLVMLAFVILCLILLVYYVGRLITLFVGTVLSPLVILLWLVPGFRDFSETAVKTYLTTVVVLPVHVCILQLSASLFSGMASSDASNVLMSMILGLATVVALLKTQGLMMQFSFVSLGARSTRQLGKTFVNGVSYVTNKRQSTKAASARSLVPQRYSQPVVISSNSHVVHKFGLDNNISRKLSRSPSAIQTNAPASPRTPDLKDSKNQKEHKS